MSLNIFLRLEFATPAYVACIGVNRASLLEAIATFGSVSAAARIMKANLRSLWGIIRDINEDFGDIVVLKRGQSRGALVTAEGLALLQQYRTIETGVRQAFAEDIRAIEKLIGHDPQRPRHWLEWDRWRQLSPPKIENFKRRTYATKSTIANSIPLSVHVYLALFAEKLWVGEGKIIMLRAIARHGSIAAAARAMDLPYYGVKIEIKRMNRDLGEIVLTQRGRDGGAILTARGAELTDRFCRIQCGIHDKFARELAFAAHLVGGNKGTKINRRLARWMEVTAELGACDDIYLSGVGTNAHSRLIRAP